MAVTAAPGAQVDLDIDYRAWSRESCPACSYRILVGIDGTYAAYAEIGGGSYANTDGQNTGTAMLTITAPAAQGSYGLYALIYAGAINMEEPSAQQVFYEGADGMSFPNRDRYVPLATLTVE